MPEVQPEGRQTLGPGGAHIVLAQDLEHRRSGHPSGWGERGEGEGKGGKRQVNERALERRQISRQQAVDHIQPRDVRGRRVPDRQPPGQRQPSQPAAEGELHHEPKDENRKRQAAQAGELRRDWAT